MSYFKWSAFTLFALIPSSGFAQTDSIAATSATSPAANQISVSGTFTVTKGTKLTAIAVWAFPTNGGLLGSTSPVNPNIDPVKGTWGPIVLQKTDNICKNLYSIRVDGQFSDSTSLISSAYVSLQTQGDAPGNPPDVKLSYQPGSPSTGNLSISLSGTYIGTPVATNKESIYTSPLGGGPLLNNSTLITTQTLNGPPPAGTWVSQPAIVVPAAGSYTVVAFIGDSQNAKYFYCAPVVNVTVPANQ